MLWYIIALWFWILIPPVVAVCTLLVCIWRRPTPSKQTNFHAYRHLQNLLGFTSNAEKDNLELSASHQKYCWEQILHQLKKSNISKCQKHDLLRGQCWMQTQFIPPRAHSMATANLKKSEDFVTNTTTAIFFFALQYIKNWTKVVPGKKEFCSWKKKLLV